MNNYEWTSRLFDIWTKAQERYHEGKRPGNGLLDPADIAFLGAIGQTEQEMFDYAEDYLDGGMPDFGSVVTVADIRRDYFLNIQHGARSGDRINPTDLPPKSAEARGLQWLPRIHAKAVAKIRGELDSDTMYGCGGDRHFLSTHNIHPSEFLRAVRDNLDDKEALYDWVEQRAKA